MSETTTGVGIIGLGFMGRTHLAAYRAAAHEHGNRVLAVCTKDLGNTTDARERGNLDTGAKDDTPGGDEQYQIFEEASDLFAMDGIELVSICTPTPTHVDLAIAALEAGKHVLVEKPVALSAGEVERLQAVARRSGRHCMPALCMRFWPAWSWLREQIRGGSLGRVQSAVFRRLGAQPSWSRDFYGDPNKSGGALFDLHIHDADFVLACFGEPRAVHCTGSIDHLTAAYTFDDGPRHVVAEGGWDLDPGWDFEMNYTVVFEGATADFRLGRADELLLISDGQAQAIEVGHCNGYDMEIRHMLSVVQGKTSDLAVTLDDALGLTRLLETEAKSLGRS